MLFFTADLHLNHKKIIEYCNRPFSSISEMNDVLISNWNQKIGTGDLVYILGDFAFSRTRFFLEALNGLKVFIDGDHDKEIHDSVMPVLHKGYLHILDKDCFNNSDKERKYFVSEISSITLCHWCMRTWRQSHYNSWHLYAHSHGHLPPIGKSWDVGVDANNFAPLSLLEIIEIMKTRPDNPNLVKKERNQ